jgi:hypothetical protein
MLALNGIPLAFTSASGRTKEDPVKTKQMFLTGAFLSMLSIGLPIATASAQTRDRVSPQLVPVPDDDYGRQQYDRGIVDLWNQRGTGASFHPGERMKVSFRTHEDAYVVVIDIDTRGRASLLFPDNRYDDGFVRAGHTVTLPGRNAGYKLQVTGPAGVERIVAFASDEPLADQWQDLINDDTADLGWSQPRYTSWNAGVSVNTGNVRGMVAAGGVQRNGLEPRVIRVPDGPQFLGRDETWFRVLRGNNRGW